MPSRELAKNVAIGQERQIKEGGRETMDEDEGGKTKREGEGEVPERGGPSFRSLRKD